ncbi:hypothetical protein [Flavobacterium nitratireducens]|uniref:hypothetical protein n=1 Tax=Flavobacterium nitratireducens TaxID=992289 RepID=UPI0030F5C2EB
MKKLFLIALFFCGLVTSQAQELKWYTDVKEAVAVSNKESKPLFLFLLEVTGADGVFVCKKKFF